MELILDYESRSRVDLKKSGSIEYARHPSTELICIGYKIDDTKTKLWCPSDGAIPNDLLDCLATPSVKLIAHNAGFEQAITRWVLPKYFNKYQNLDPLPHERWKCTAAKAAAHALPRSLDGACSALKLRHQKDKEGSKLLKKYYKPRKPTKNDPREWHDDPLDLMRIYEYCIADIDAQYELDHALPDLSAYEQKVWVLDQTINFRGITLDIPSVKNILEIAATEQDRLKDQINELTNGEIESATKTAQVLKYVNALGADLPNMQKATVENFLLGKEVDSHVREVLEIRQDASMTSLGKYKAMIARSDVHHIARDHLLYHGASTGRWSGRGIQLQNLPRGIEGLDGEEAVDVINTGGVDLMRMMYGNDVMGVLSSVIRTMIRAPEGEELFDADFAGIEVRVLFWLANHEDGLQAFIDKRDLYKELAAVIYGVKVSEIEKGEKRDLGKRAVLGCGYGMGEKRFHETCEEYQLFIPPAMAKRAVKAYRSLHAHVPQLWSNYERAAIMAVRSGKRVSINRVTFFVQDNFLYVKLPSGRHLAYYRPRVVKTTKWDRPHYELRHWHEDPKTKQWCETVKWGGVWTENIDQAIARDLMVAAMLRLEVAGYPLLLTVHDEALARRKLGEGSLDEFNNLMRELPAWAKGLPVDVDGWKGKTFKK